MVQLALIAVAAATALAPPILTLDLPHAVAYALKHDPALLARHAQVSETESRYAKLHASQFPTVDGELQSQLQKTENMPGQLAQYGLTPTPDFSLNTAQVSSNWNLWNGGLAQLQAQEAKRKMESAELDYRRAEDQKALDVASAFYAVANKRIAVELARSDRVYQQALVEIAVARENAGLVAAVDVLRARAAEARSEATLVQDEADAENATENLTQTIGAPLNTTFVIQDPLPEPRLPETPFEAMIALAEKTRPDVAAASANLAAALIAEREINTDFYPKISVTGAFGNQFSPTAYGAELEQIAQSNALDSQFSLPLVPIPSRGNPGFWQIGASATLGFPLVDYGTRHAEHRAAHEQIGAATAALDAAKRSVELDVRSSFRTAQAALVSLGYAKLAASASIESARIAQLQYRGGLISFADVASAQQQTQSSQTDLENASTTYLIALIRLRISLGTYDPVQAVAW